MTASGHERPERSTVAISASPQVADIAAKRRDGREGPGADIIPPTPAPSSRKEKRSYSIGIINERRGIPSAWDR